MSNHIERFAIRNLPLARAAISVLLFVAAGMAVAPSMAPSMASSDQGPIAAEPASAFPSDTVFYLELREPVAIVDKFREMAFWPHVVSLMSEAVDLLGSPKGSSEALSRALGSWGEESKLRRCLQQLAGKRCVAGLVPIKGSDRVAPLFLLERSASAGSLLPLASIVGSFEEGATLRTAADVASDRFSILDSRGVVLLVGRVSDRWLVVSTPAGTGSLDRAAGALCPAGPPLDAPLSAVGGFVTVMADLPESANARAYLSSAGVVEMIDRSSALSSLGKRLARSCFSWTGAIGIARELGPDSIRTWMTGQILEDEINEAVPGLLDALTPIEEPLSRWLPRNALCAYEVGAPPDAVFDMVCFFVKSLSPWLHQEIEMLCADFESATGLDPAVDLFPYLDRSMAVAALPSGGPKAEWPFPRSVVMVRVTDEEKVKAFVSSFIQWDATMWAPFSGGLIGGRAVTSHHDGVELIGIELDSVIRLPLPSPTVAIVDGFLIASSFRSGVIDTIAALRGERPALSAETITSARTIPDSTVELVHLNFPSWKSEWARCWKAAASPCCYLMLDREYVASVRLSEEKLYRLGEALFNVVTSLDRTTGTTTVGSDGRFEFFIEVRVR